MTLPGIFFEVLLVLQVVVLLLTTNFYDYPYHSNFSSNSLLHSIEQIILGEQLLLSLGAGQTVRKGLELFLPECKDALKTLGVLLKKEAPTR